MSFDQFLGEPIQQKLMTHVLENQTAFHINKKIAMKFFKKTFQKRIGIPFTMWRFRSRRPTLADRYTQFEYHFF